MRRLAVLGFALVFVGGFAILTADVVAEQGLTAAGVIAILILVLLAVGIIGAIGSQPRDPPR
jgi:hypothetical protein